MKLPRHIASRTAAVVGLAAVVVMGTDATAQADPIPGYTFDAQQLLAGMEACRAYAVGEDHLLMGWWNLSTGAKRQWRCGSLRHMLDPDADRDNPVVHDPFTDVEGFMHCVDRVVSYGFVRKASAAGKKQHILQHHGIKRHANVIYDESTGDITTIYTDPDNDWAECASWKP